MRHEINVDLLDVVRELSRSTTPQELQSRGVRRVRSIGVNAVSLLIEKAVNRTLMKRTIGGLAESEQSALVAEAEAEFTAQLAELEVLTDSRELIERQREKVRSDLAALREAILLREGGEPLDPAAKAAEDAAHSHDLRLQVQALLLPLHEVVRKGGLPGVRRHAEQLIALLERHEQAALAEQRRELEGEIALLERRVAKLVSSLETTEKVLDELAKMKDVEHGIASIYRSVQGLDSSEFEREKKLDMLERIFHSNLALRALIAQGAHAVEPA